MKAYLSKVMAYVPDENLKYNPKVCYKTELRDTFYDELIGNIWKADEKLISEVKRNFYKWYAKVEDIRYGMKCAAG